MNNIIRQKQEYFSKIGVTDFALNHSEMIGSALNDEILYLLCFNTFNL